MKNPIVHFEIPADNVERAKKFYEKIFDWKITKMDMPGGDYWIIRTMDVDKNNMPIKKGSGINGGMMKRQSPGQAFTNYVHVESIDKTLKIATANGGKMCMPKMDIGKDMGSIAGFTDPEGNFIGIHEGGPEMKD